jgi:RNase P subunit RPR2
MDMGFNEVTHWRCQCGIGIKLLTETETDRARINENDRIEVVCPQCGDKQLIHAHRIVELSTEKPEPIP